MRFREFYKVSEAKFNPGQVKRHGLDKPTTLRRNIDGWDVWFKDAIMELPDITRKKRKILYALNDRNLSQDTIDYIRRNVKGLLSHGNKLSLNKFHKARTFRNSMMPDESLYSTDKATAKIWSEFAKKMKGLDIDNLDPAIEQLADRKARLMTKFFLGDHQKDAERWFRHNLLALLEHVSGMRLPVSILDNHSFDRLYTYIHYQMDKVGADAATNHDFNRRVVEDIKEELLQSVRHIADMFQAYYVQFKEPEVKSLMENVKRILEDAVGHLADNLGKQYGGDDHYAVGHFSDMIRRHVMPKLDAYLEQDVKEFVGSFVNNVRQSRRNIDSDNNVDGLIYYMAYRAVSAVRDLMIDEIRAGKDTDESEFQQWVEKASQNFSKVARTLQSIGIRKFARVPVIFHYQDWPQRWNNITIGGLHTLGDKRMQKVVNPDTSKPYKIGGPKHEHYIQMYTTDVATIAHEIGHAVYYLLPPEQQESVRSLANQGPVPSNYASPEYRYPGNPSPSYAHQTGNEWFAEMLGLLVSRPELLNAPIRIGADTREFYPKGSDKPLNSFPEKPHPLDKQQTRKLNDTVLRFKEIFANQTNALRGYKFGVESKPRLPRRLRGTSPQQPTPQPPSSSNPTP